MRLRRGVLYRISAEVGATKIALEHHADDFVETLLLNPAVCRVAEGDAGATVSDDGRRVVIRPLDYVPEDEARAYTRECSLEVIDQSAAVRSAATSASSGSASSVGCSTLSASTRV